MPRAFTYNNGAPIEGTLQYGNLAVEASPLVFSTNPGGKKWWMGPDEDGIYIIAKDVPTIDWPTETPEGNIGSVRFWNSDETDNAFISMSNDLPARAGESDFTDISTAYGWLISNGYWTNITNSPNFTIPFQSKMVEIMAPPYTGSGDPVDFTNDVLTSGLYYNSYDDSVYINTGRQIFYTDFATYPTGSTYFTTSEGYPQNSSWTPDNEWYTDINIFWQNQPTFDNGEYSFRRFYDFAIDSTNNKLFTHSTPFSSVTDRKLYRFNLTTKVLEDEIDIDSTLLGYKSYDPVNDRLFISNTFNGTKEYVKVITGTNLSSATQSLDVSGIGEPYMPTTGGTLTIIPIDNSSYSGDYANEWMIINNSTLSFTTGSLPSGIQNSYKPFYGGTCAKGAYNSSSNKFYIYAWGYDDKSYVVTINGTDGSYEAITAVQNGSNTMGSLVYGSDLVYDSSRNYIWGINRSKKVFALNCSDNALIGEWQPQTYDSGFFNAYFGTLTLDPVNDLLIWGKNRVSNRLLTFDLSLFR